MYYKNGINLLLKILCLLLHYDFYKIFYGTYGTEMDENIKNMDMAKWILIISTNVFVSGLYILQIQKI